MKKNPPTTKNRPEEEEPNTIRATENNTKNSNANINIFVSETATKNTGRNLTLQ